MVTKTRSADQGALLEAAVGGDRRALARLVSIAERGGEASRRLAALAHVRRQGAYTLGLTGAPGAGKSTLTDGLVGEARASGDRIAVVAIDPSSPFTGGAILGDRVRLNEHHIVDEGVYVRSLANRGHLGGLARAVPGAIGVLDATGWDWIVVETVGVGQAEVSIAAQADTTIVVVNPGWGDAVQANKAGLLEIADVLVVNKADRPGSEDVVRDLEGMLALGAPRGWNPPIVTAAAIDGEGVDRVWGAVAAHRRHLQHTGDLERRRGARRVTQLRDQVLSELTGLAIEAERAAEGQELLAAVRDGAIDPGTAATDLLADALRRFRH
jgi:LAO/AO transport system kinase